MEYVFLLPVADLAGQVVSDGKWNLFGDLVHQGGVWPGWGAGGRGSVSCVSCVPQRRKDELESGRPRAHKGLLRRGRELVLPLYWRLLCQTHAKPFIVILKMRKARRRAAQNSPASHGRGAVGCGLEPSPWSRWDASTWWARGTGIFGSLFFWACLWGCFWMGLAFDSADGVKQMPSPCGRKHLRCLVSIQTPQSQWAPLTWFKLFITLTSLVSHAGRGAEPLLFPPPASWGFPLKHSTNVFIQINQVGSSVPHFQIISCLLLYWGPKSTHFISLCHVKIRHFLNSLHPAFPCHPQDMDGSVGRCACSLEISHQNGEPVHLRWCNHLGTIRREAQGETFRLFSPCIWNALMDLPTC